jgi:hypothetical protein
MARMIHELGKPLTVCHCFAEAVLVAPPPHCSPSGKQWHTAVNNLGLAMPPDLRDLRTCPHQRGHDTRRPIIVGEAAANRVNGETGNRAGL